MSQYGIESFGVLTTLAAYHIVAANTAGSNNVLYAAGATIRPIGVTKDTVKDTTGAIAVAIAGIAKVQCNDTFSSGSMIAADATGLGVKHADTTAGSYVIGVALQPCAATGTLVDLVVQPHFKSIP